MYKLFISGCLLMLLCARLINAQTPVFNQPDKESLDRSVLFGKDIIIDDQPDKNQRNVAIATAFNGWLYAAVVYDTLLRKNLKILRSMDNGISWTQLVILKHSCVEQEIITKIKIITCGKDLSNLKIIIGWVRYNTFWGGKNASLGSINGVTGVLEQDFLTSGIGGSSIQDIDLCNDEDDSASGAYPGSFAFVYSYYGFTSGVYVRTSGDGGLSLGSKKTIIENNNKYYPSVSLSYGKSSTWNSGRFFACWQENDYDYSLTGHIYYAHSEPDYNSSFTVPFCIDSLDPSSINIARNPVISSQYGMNDNDSSNITTIVMFENGVGSGEIKAFYNKKSTLTNYFHPYTFPAPTHHNTQPFLVFNPHNSTFNLTWYDSTEKKLPFMNNHVNMTNPSTWNTISDGYNDESNITNPVPVMAMNHSEQSPVCAWISEGGGRGLALFDAQNSTYTVLPENIGSVVVHGAYPNPCDLSTSIYFKLQKQEKVSLSLCTLTGQTFMYISGKEYPPGTNTIGIDLSNFPKGCYLYFLNFSNRLAVGKLLIIHN